jgi:hypothetical protein
MRKLLFVLGLCLASGLAVHAQTAGQITGEVKAVATGFKVVEHPNVELQVQQVLRQDFALEVGQTTQTVEVTGSAELLTTDSAAVGTIIEQKQIIDIPLNGRNYIYLVA